MAVALCYWLSFSFSRHNQGTAACTVCLSKGGKKVYVHMRSGGTLSMEISYLFEKKDVRK